MTGGKSENPGAGAQGSSNSPDKRAATRIAERCEIHYRVVEEGVDTPKRFASETLNISSSGLCLVSEEALRPDQHLALELDLKDREKPVVAVGRVVWCDRDGTSFRVGVCFTWLRDEDRRDLGRIAEFVRARLDERS